MNLHPSNPQHIDGLRTPDERTQQAVITTLRKLASEYGRHIALVSPAQARAVIYAHAERGLSPTAHCRSLWVACADSPRCVLVGPGGSNAGWWLDISTPGRKQTLSLRVDWLEDYAKA